MSREESDEGGVYIPPVVYAFINLAMTIAFVVAGLGLAYLLYGVFVGLGGFASWDVAKQNIMLGNIALAAKAMTIGLGVGAVCVAVLFWFEELAGYVLLIAAALLGLGLPFLFPMLGGEKASIGTAKALEAFPFAAMAPGAIGFILVVRDIIAKFTGAVLRRGAETETAGLQLGAGAKREQKPLRTSLIGKCWEGNYCRDWVRPHCPIYQKRDACWRQRRGCYCEQDIVNAAAGKSQQGGVQLEMAPASQYNYANPSAPGTSAAAKVFLTDAQKAERCRNCVIYNDHQSEKYKIIMPITIVVTLALCVLFAPLMRMGISASMSGIEHLAAKLSFASSQESGLKLTRPSDPVQWALVGAFSLMIISKALQVVEWCIFTKKI
ncbi:hypothetical protein [Armatimonas rosea]|uniref:Uncharacterized protein n=1 Tax=Armatimonas rosea TaxID=685828 RepID=A0A7W9SSL1_ARMRO|nr:hypothetical protein [Armatimonas rosea]MBB6052092.1 hypothetical protein [Armatimonas rosea]